MRTGCAFDFTHFSAMTPEELKKVEEIVNEKIAAALPVVVKNMPIEEAKKTGAQALFGEKYGDIVRVVNMGDFSIEFCGGTHVQNTSEIAAFKIISETGVAAGVRRIEALTSEGLMKYYDELEEKLKNAAHLLKATPDNLADKITHLMSENKALHSEVESLKSRMAQDAVGDCDGSGEGSKRREAPCRRGGRRRYERTERPGRSAQGEAGRRSRCPWHPPMKERSA